jgi:hypothetical protein
MFYALNECNTKQIIIGDDKSFTIVGYRIVQLDDGYFNDVLCVPSLSCNLLLVYQITHSHEGKTIEFSSHKVEIENLKDSNHILATRIVDDITKLYRFDNCSNLFHKFLLLIVMK